LRFQEYKSRFQKNTSNTGDPQENGQTAINLLKMIAKTADMPASELAGGYFKLEETSPYFGYYLGKISQEPAIEFITKLEIPEDEVGKLSEEERKGREWILNWEKKVRKVLDRKSPKGVLDPLEHYLTPE
jgi:hypothetical protein